MAFTLNRGRPYFVVALKDNFGEDDEAAVNLTTATSAVFNMRTQSGTALKVNRGSCSITSAAAGEVTYQWGTLDTNTVGTYRRRDRGHLDRRQGRDLPELGILGGRDRR